jgi:subtilisin family serine protease
MKTKISLIMVVGILISQSLNVYSQLTCTNPAVINDPYMADASYDHALRLLDARCAWTVTQGSRDIVVGVIDAGFDSAHVDLANTFVGVDNVFPPADILHGTEVSSCVATGTNNGIGIAGIGYNTSVKGYTSNSIPTSIWVSALRAHDQGIRIISISLMPLGSATHDDLLFSIRSLVNRGTVLILAAGNEPDNLLHREYANIPGVIVVSGIDTTGNYKSIPSANMGPALNEFVDVCVLAWNVTTATPNNGYHRAYFGTSYAAPQVAGVVALMRSIKNDLTPAEIENMIKATADPIPNASQYPGQLGAGRVNAYKAVLAARNALCASPPQTITGIIRTTQTVSGSSVSTIGSTEVAKGSKLTITACNTVTINSNFALEPGAEFEVRIYPL